MWDTPEASGVVIGGRLSANRDQQELLIRRAHSRAAHHGAPFGGRQITDEADGHVPDRLPERHVELSAERVQQRSHVIGQSNRHCRIVPNAFAWT